jgi:hypothetical protein
MWSQYTIPLEEGVGSVKAILHPKMVFSSVLQSVRVTTY